MTALRCSGVCAGGRRSVKQVASGAVAKVVPPEKSCWYILAASSTDDHGAVDACAVGRRVGSTLVGASGSPVRVRSANQGSQRARASVVCRSRHAGRAPLVVPIETAALRDLDHGASSRDWIGRRDHAAGSAVPFPMGRPPRPAVPARMATALIEVACRTQCRRDRPPSATAITLEISP
jgi:hypothetical protein